MNALRELLGRSGPYEPPSTMELLKRTPLGALEETVKVLKQLRPAEEVREAMVERIAQAPAGDFDTLKYIYLKHCGDAAR